MVIVDYWIDVENSSGVKQGKGPLRPKTWHQVRRLDACGEFSFTVSGGDPNLSALAEKRVVFCWHQTGNGDVEIFGSGVIDKITKRFDETGALWIDVSGNDIGRELTYRSVRDLVILASPGVGTIYAPSNIMSWAPDGWTLGGEIDTKTAVYAGFDGESVLTALTKIGEHILEHWRIEPNRQLTWLGTRDDYELLELHAMNGVNGPVDLSASSNTAIIYSLEEESDAADLVNRVFPRGSGNGGAVITLSTCTDNAPDGYSLDQHENHLDADDSITEYDWIERSIDFKEIGPLSNTTADIQAASNMLLLASVSWLKNHAYPQKYYRVGLLAPALLPPGTRFRMQYKHWQDDVLLYDLDDVFSILEVTHEISEAGAYTVSLTISATSDRLPQSDADYLAGEMQAARVLATHQQLGASTDTLTWREEMDDAHGATMRFWIGSEYTSIQRALYRFRIQPLRSTVKSVGGSSATTGSGGGTSTTSGDGGATTKTSSSGGGSTATSSDGRGDSVVGGTHNHGSPSYSDSENGGYHNHLLPNHNHDITFSPHTHTTEFEDHSHSINIQPHTHSVTANVSMAYGIYEESSANTLTLADLVIKLNTSDDLRSAVHDIGNGWYELDITIFLVNTVFRPYQENNAITITTGTVKTARIEAQLTIRGVVQAVKYS